jgi:hypothetical protein
VAEALLSGILCCAIAHYERRLLVATPRPVCGRPDSRSEAAA